VIKWFNFQFLVLLMIYQSYVYGDQILPFKNIFVIQILGILIARKFSGVANFVIGNQDSMADVWLNGGMVINVHYINLTGLPALKTIAWHHEGKLELVSQLLYNDPLAHYSHLVESLIKDAPPDMINTCPMLMNSFINHVKLKPLKNSVFSLAGLTVFGEIGLGHSLTEIPRKNLSEKEFLDGFWYLTCHGLVIVSYAKSVGLLVQKFQYLLIDKMKTLMGTHIADTYKDKLWQNIHQKWANFEKEPDPIYGTSPYQLWLHQMQETSQQVGTPILQKGCFESVLTALAPQNAKVIHHFLN